MTTSGYTQLNKIYDENYFCYFLFNVAARKKNLNFICGKGDLLIGQHRYKGVVFQI